VATQWNVTSQLHGWMLTHCCRASLMSFAADATRTLQPRWYIIIAYFTISYSCFCSHLLPSVFGWVTGLEILIRHRLSLATFWESPADRGKALKWLLKRLMCVHVSISVVTFSRTLTFLRYSLRVSLVVDHIHCSLCECVHVIH